MKTRLTALALIMSLLFLVPLQAANAQDNSKHNNLSESSSNSSTLRYSLPITGSFTDQSGGLGTFSGTLNIQRFAVISGRLNVLGTVSGSLTDSLGKVLVTTVQTVALPVTFPSAVTPTSQSVPERSVTFSKASYRSTGDTPKSSLAATTVTLPQVGPCNILNLSIGTIDLNVLGLTVHLNPILLVINAVPGAGNLLGNLLCAVTNLLNGVGNLVQIAQLLNQILAILTALGG